jgi:hypothetical protein
MPGFRSPFSHQSCQSAPQRLWITRPALTLGPILALKMSAASLHTPLLPPMLSTQNGLDMERQPCVLLFWYMYFM